MLLEPRMSTWGRPRGLVQILTCLLICGNNYANHSPSILLKEMHCKLHWRVVIVSIQWMATWTRELCLFDQPITNIDCSTIHLLIFVPAVNLVCQHNSQDCTINTEGFDAVIDGLCRHVLYERISSSTVFYHWFINRYLLACGPYLS